MRAWRGTIAGVCAGLLGAAGLAGCGGSGDSNTPPSAAGAAPRLQVTAARFPARQRLAQPVLLTIAVRNVGRRTVPDIAVTVCNVTCAADAPDGEGTSVAAFGYPATGTDLADVSRPAWIILRPPGDCAQGCADETGDGGAVTAASNTWSLGPLRPGRTARFTWRLSPVLAGRWHVAWQLAGELIGRSVARTATGQVPGGTFRVQVARGVARYRVSPSGRVVVSG